MLKKLPEKISREQSNFRNKKKCAKNEEKCAKQQVKHATKRNAT